MTLNEYQERAKKTAVYTNWNDRLVCTTLGLNGEAGEVAEKVKKIIRDKTWEFQESDRVEVRKELGDVLWYLSVLADTLGWKLEEVATNNLDKLASRAARGVLSGNGDDR